MSEIDNTIAALRAEQQELQGQVSVLEKRHEEMDEATAALLAERKKLLARHNDIDAVVRYHEAGR